jgi:acetyltransferase
MTIRNLQYLFAPTSVALIGASEEAATPGAQAARNLRNSGFSGEIFLVSRESREIEGLPTYRRISKLPRAPDLAILAAPLASLPALLSELGALGAKAAVAIGADFSTPMDRDLLQAMREASKPYLLRIVGPDCLGICVPSIGLNAGFGHLAPRPGHLAFIAQSRAMVTTVLDWAHPRGLGFSHLVSLGEMVDVDFGDILDYLANDNDTHAILLYIESITQARKFMSAARAAARAKPVIVVKAGLYRERGPVCADAVYDAAFRRAGMLRVHRLVELFDAVETLALEPKVRGDGVVLVTNGRGIGEIAADALYEQGGRLAELSPATLARLDEVLPPFWSRGNPLDILDDADGARYRDTLAPLLEDRDIDAVMVLHCPTALASSIETAEAVIETLERAPFGAPCVFTSWLSDASAQTARQRFAERRIPTYDTPTGAVQAFMSMVRYRNNQALLMQTPLAIPEAFRPDVPAARQWVEGALAAGRSWLAPEEAAGLLSAYDIPIRQGAVRSQRTEKSGTVAVGVHELAIRVVENSQFGPIIQFGQGAPNADMTEDTALGLPPLNLHLAREIMSRTRIYRRMERSETVPDAHLDALALVLVKISQLIIDLGEIRELSTDSLSVGAGGPSVLRAQIRVANATESGAQRLVIRPYPQELEETVTLPDGRVFTLRPVRPEDEPGFHYSFSKLTPEDIRMRFMYPMKLLTHAMAARFTQIDYDREMAFVLEGDIENGEKGIYGVARLVADPNNERAEFAIIVGEPVRGTGLGVVLMRRLIDYARDRGIQELFGEVLKENKSMLGLCEYIGFTIHPSPDEPTVMEVSLAL